MCVLFPQLMSKETPVSSGSDSFVDLDRQVVSASQESDVGNKRRAVFV